MSGISSLSRSKYTGAPFGVGNGGLQGAGRSVALPSFTFTPGSTVKKSSRGGKGIVADPLLVASVGMGIIAGDSVTSPIFCKILSLLGEIIIEPRLFKLSIDNWRGGEALQEISGFRSRDDSFDLYMDFQQK